MRVWSCTPFIIPPHSGPSRDKIEGQKALIKKLGDDDPHHRHPTVEGVARQVLEDWRYDPEKLKDQR